MTPATATRVAHMDVIRPAVAGDIPAMVRLGEAMHGESRFHVMRWDGAKVADLIASLIQNPDGLALVAVHDGQVVGGFLGMVAAHFFSPDRMATDLALFVSPNRRGGLLGVRLLRSYARWAGQRGAVLVQAGVTTGVNVESTCRLFTTVGFAPIGHLFEFTEPSNV